MFLGKFNKLLKTTEQGKPENDLPSNSVLKLTFPLLQDYSI